MDFLDFPKNIRKVSHGVIAMMLDDETEMFICPNGKVFTKKQHDSRYMMYNQYDHFPNKLAYCGDVNLDFKPHGQGKFLFYADNEYLTYVGDAEDGQIRGEGILTWRNGTVAEGIFDRNYFEGKRTYPNGDVLVGMWTNDVLDMLKTADFADGRKIYNTVHGLMKHFIAATMILPDVGNFVGQIWNTSLQPYRGTMPYLEGRIYEGEFDCNHLMHGNGKMTLPTGVSYAGKWQNGYICILVPGILTLIGEHQGEIRGHPTVGLMAEHLTMDDFSYKKVEKVEEEKVEEEEEEEDDE